MSFRLLSPGRDGNFVVCHAVLCDVETDEAAVQEAVGASCIIECGCEDGRWYDRCLSDVGVALNFRSDM